MLTSADTVFHGLALLASLGCGLNGGFFFAFSVAVMRRRLRGTPATAIMCQRRVRPDED